MPPVYFIRHALSVWNVEGRWQGQADPPLSKVGREQARAAAAGLGPVRLVITSDLERARHTGQLLAPGAPHLTEPLLREFDVGEWSGRTRAEIERTWPGELAAFDAGALPAPPGGEARSDFDARVRSAAERVRQLVAGAVSGVGTARAAGTAATLVVSHGGVVRAWARLLGCGDRHVGHLCGYQAAIDGAELSLVRPVNLLEEVSSDAAVGDRLAL